MRTSKLLLFFLYVFLFTSCESVNDIYVGSIEDVSINTIGTRAIEFDIMMPIDNPSSLRFKIRDVDLDVIINGINIGKISNITDFGDVVIPARSSELYIFPLRVEFSDFIGSAFSLIGAFLGRETEVEISGEIGIRSLFVTRKVVVKEKETVRFN